MSLDKETMVLAFTGSQVAITIDLPKLQPKVMTFECVDPRKCRAMRAFSKHMGIDEGELLPYKTPGGINNLLSSVESIKNECFEFIKLGFDLGAKHVWLVSHTCCAADKKKYGKMSFEQDISCQEKKLLDSTRKVLEYSEKNGMALRVKPIFFHIIDSKAYIHVLDHKFTPSGDPLTKQSVLMETALSAASVFA